MRVGYLAVIASLAVAACDKDSTGPGPGAGTDAGGPAVCRNIEGVVDAKDGLQIRKPEASAAVCIEQTNPAGQPERHCVPDDTPDFACIGMADPLGTPSTVTFKGCVETFGIGAESDGLVVTVFREKDAGGQPVDPGYDVTGPTGAQSNNSPGAVLGRTVSTRVAETECEDRGAFEIADIPTETDLIVRVTDQNSDADLRLYVDVYKYNVRLRNKDVVDLMGAAVADPVNACGAGTDCVVIDEVNTIAIATFTTIPRAAGVSVITGEDNLFDGMGQGHVAGEVQDCTSENRIQNAVVSISTKARKLAYFNVGFMDRDDIQDPKPESTRNRTNADGLYAAIGVDTQIGGEPAVVGAAITRSLCGADDVCRCTDDLKENPAWTAADAMEAEVTVLGARTIYVFPDSITVMTFDRELYTTP